MNKKELLPYFGRKSEILSMFPAHCHKGGCKRERHIYVDNGAPFLLVAHIDTVITPRLDRVNKGAGFDDRLGVYTGHKLVNKYPKLFDLLLTDYEESGCSTAQFFTPSHLYSVIIGLDREGAGFVDYDLASEELKNALWAYGLHEEIGSFSDICFMDHIKCSKINLGLGTAYGHSSHSGFSQTVFYGQISNLLDFCNDNKKKTWPEPKPSWSTNYYAGCYTFEYSGMCQCEWCEQMFDESEMVELFDSRLCENCAHYLYQDYMDNRVEFDDES